MVRFKYIVHLDLDRRDDLTWNMVNFAIWTALEVWWYVPRAEIFKNPNRVSLSPSQSFN